MRYFLKSVGAIALSLILLLFVGGLGVSRFPFFTCAHTYYLYSPSSQAVQKGELSLQEWQEVKGESIRFSCTDGGTALEIFERLNAELLFIEDAGEVRSYYGFSEKWRDGVWLQGHFINLHVAIGQGRCTVGSPMIFGSF